MKDEMQHSEGQPSDLQVDIEGLLTAIQARTSGEIREYMDQDQQPRVEVEGRVFHSYTELAEAFEIDISNYRA
ncbi:MULTISPECIES: DUF2525 domain-containing protein [unclassified Pantoea]|uniref:DUF2525 domain-containing protein n=1 Tax=unclassified Pantoea TaxID=2630326 RepID=UPI0001E08349|nr:MULTISPECIES: DUF2525 domain-containing protein [unclassified Pantoea]EFM17953.1 putative cytoplasmic protein [Pantoea sp. aB]MDF2041669.1 DUF2525 domain-containing protein [Pantoea sp. Cr_R14]MDF2070722.1 DUF2525 domain-containing protein [Pantoea sp. Cr_R13]MDF2081014.1 DUF2525 domain-containing protein [Pantoea sp. Cr_R21]QNQ60160.1 DUF2525 domain-containing protein [Pantoea sp. MT58]